MQEELNTSEARTWKMFLRAHAALVRQMEVELQAAHGISLTWMDVLVQLSLADDHRMTHSRLGERLLVSGGNVTRLVDRMAKAGLVRRQASKTDRRTIYVVLTEEGARALDEMMPTHFESVRRLFIRHLRPADVPVLNGFLARLLGEE